MATALHRAEGLGLRSAVAFPRESEANERNRALAGGRTKVFHARGWSSPLSLPRSPQQWGAVRALRVLRHTVTSEVGQRMMRTPADYPWHWLQEEAHFKRNHWPLNSIVLNYLQVPIYRLFFSKYLCCFPSLLSGDAEDWLYTSTYIMDVLRGIRDPIHCASRRRTSVCGGSEWHLDALPHRGGRPSTLVNSQLNSTPTWKTSREGFSNSYTYSSACQCTVVII